MRKVIAVALIAVGLVLATPPDTTSASTGCVTRQEFGFVRQRTFFGLTGGWEPAPRSYVRGVFDTPGQRIAYYPPPRGQFLLGFEHPPTARGAELRAYETCRPGGAVWVYFFKTTTGAWWVGHTDPFSGVPAMWWFN